jgi:hypothetical protein
VQLGYPVLSQYEQAAMFDPTNPNQRQYVQYAQIPGTYGSSYINRVPVTAELKGSGLGLWQIRNLPPAAGVNGLGTAVEYGRSERKLTLMGLGTGWAGIPMWGQAALVLALGTAVGYVGWQKFGPAIKKKVPMLSGPKSKRRRR